MKSPTWRPLAAALCVTAAAATIPRALAADWPILGGTPARNMVSPEKGLPATAVPGKPKGDTDEVDPATTRNVKWVAKLGSECFGNPTVAGGRVFVGTNNGAPRDPKYKDDYGVVMCFDEATGQFLWQLAVPKLGAGGKIDYPNQGVCSSPTVDGDRVYLVTNRCEVVCLTTAGQAAGNEGPFKDEAQYAAGPGKPPIPQGPTDADIVWRYDLRLELGVTPKHMTSSSVLVVGDRLYVNTSNGTDWTDKHVPAPNAPALVCLDKKTGKLLAEERSGISARTLYGNWSSPAYGPVAGRPTVVFGGGDGFCYGFDPEPAPGPDGTPVLKELWRVDCNPPGTRVKDGKPVTPGSAKGPGLIAAAPVVCDDRVYVPTGWISEAGFGKGPGCLNCIGAAGSASKGGAVDVVWRFTGLTQTASAASVADGLLYLADTSGVVHCLDAKTGAPVWTHDIEGEIVGSTLLADGKVYVPGFEGGEVTVLAAGREKKALGKIDLGTGIPSTPIAANGVLYVATSRQLYAFK